MTTVTALRILRDAGCDPRVEGDRLKLDEDPPDELPEAHIDILNTPIRELVTGDKLYAIDEDGHGCAHPDGLLDLSGPLPLNVRLIAVAGTAWDRISPYAMESFPHLFTLAAMKTKARKGADHADQPQLPH
ncbi:MAG: hypothetical protein KF873_03095 [Gemmataceae bacterium]|nr:hypothetical protein [Gemmataceae bacterium]